MINAHGRMIKQQILLGLESKVTHPLLVQVLVAITQQEQVGSQYNILYFLT